jgi:hypothetical protein
MVRMYAAIYAIRILEYSFESGRVIIAGFESTI